MLDREEITRAAALRAAWDAEAKNPDVNLMPLTIEVIRARATIPTAEGKRAAWASVVDSAALPNATVRATCLGFRRSGRDRSSILRRARHKCRPLTR